MTEEEAIKTIEIAKADIEWNYPMDYQEAFDIAIDCIGKQIPKKPIYDDGDYYCAECEEKLETYLFSRCISYCSGCGQAHDWNEVE